LAARQQAIDRVQDQIDRANVTQATVAFGVSMEKIMLLLGELGGRVPLQVNTQMNAEQLHARFNEMHERLFESVRSSAESKEALPNGETFSDRR